MIPLSENLNLPPLTPSLQCGLPWQGWVGEWVGVGGVLLQPSTSHNFFGFTSVGLPLTLKLRVKVWSQDRMLAGSCKPFSWSEEKSGHDNLSISVLSAASRTSSPWSPACLCQHNYSPHSIWLNCKSSYSLHPAQSLQRPRPPATKKVSFQPCHGKLQTQSHDSCCWRPQAVVCRVLQGAV